MPTYSMGACSWRNATPGASAPAHGRRTRTRLAGEDEDKEDAAEERAGDDGEVEDQAIQQ
jgi:hypothetical protein